MKRYSLFYFTVKYFGCLKALPLVPHLFDSLLKLWALVARPRLLNWLDEIETEVLSWKDTHIGTHKYGGLQFNYKGKQIGHIHSNGLLDILYSRKIKQQLMEDGRIEPHHVFKESGWISFYIDSAKDAGYAKKLLRMSYNRLSQIS